MKLADSIQAKIEKLETNDLKESLKYNLIACVLTIKEINKFPNTNRGEIIAHQKLKQKSWVKMSSLFTIKIY